MPRKSILFLGSYGTENHGDEALLTAARNIVAKLRPETELKVLSRAPDIRKLQGMPVIYYGKRSPWKTFKNLARELRGAEALVLGGGGLLNDHYKGNLFYFGMPILLARLLGRQVLFLGLGVGPFRRTWRRRLASWLLARGQVLSVRDETSLGELRGRARRSAFVGSDLTWGLPVGEGEEPTPGILLSLRPWADWNEDRVLEHVLELIAGLPRELPLRLVAMDEHRDRPILARVEAATGENRRVEWIEARTDTILAAFASTQWVIAMRFHAALFAARSGAALHLIAYDAKLHSLARDLGLESVWTPDKVMPEPAFGQASDEAIERQVSDASVHSELAERCLCES